MPHGRSRELRSRPGSAVLWSCTLGLAALGYALISPVVIGQDASPDASPAASSEPLAVNPYTGAIPGSGVGRRIGYVSLGDQLRDVRRVSQGIAAQAAIAGADLIACDSRIDPEIALGCARQLAANGVQGVINFQLFEDRSAEICEAYGSLPTIAVEIAQPPCEVSRVGMDNRAAGRQGGLAIGTFARDAWDCAYTAFISIESSAAGATSDDRIAGYRDGFQEACPLDPARERSIDASASRDAVTTSMAGILASLAGDRIIVVSVNEAGVLDARSAAGAQGREADVFYGGQGTDPSIWRVIACDPQYIASIANFPERYGQTAIPAMIDILNGQIIPTRLLTPTAVVTAANIRTIYPETPAC